MSWWNFNASSFLVFLLVWFSFFLKEIVAYKHWFVNKRIKETSILAISKDRVPVILITLKLTNLSLNVFLSLIFYGEKMQTAPEPS